MNHPTSRLQTIVWPAIPTPEAAQRLSVLQQIEASQWLTPQQIKQRQFAQLNPLVRYAAKTVPFYRQRLQETGLTAEKAIGPEDWLRLPLLTRSEMQTTGRGLVSQAIPREHGETNTASTSGSTGMPVTVYGTAVSKFFWEVVTLREHLWQGRDLTGTMAVIRRIPNNKADYPEGFTQAQWSAPVSSVFPNGPLHALAIESSIAQQAEWLMRVNPHYLRGYPTNLMSLARYCEAEGLRPTNLRQCLSFGELLNPRVREACRDAWGVEIADSYSSQEVGYMSLQAPGHEHQLVQADFLLVEVLDRQGHPCEPGEVGRVVVTSLHNYAMPILRYEIGDFAEVGEACPTGRGLPVLTRIMGRERNMLIDQEGHEYWPAFGVKILVKIAPIKQFQLAQVGPAMVEARLVVERELTEHEKDQIREHLASRLPGKFQVEVKRVAEIARSAGGKYEDFVNETLRRD